MAQLVTLRSLDDALGDREARQLRRKLRRTRRDSRRDKRKQNLRARTAKQAAKPQEHEERLKARAERRADRRGGGAAERQAPAGRPGGPGGRAPMLRKQAQARRAAEEEYEEGPEEGMEEPEEVWDAEEEELVEDDAYEEDVEDYMGGDVADRLKKAGNFRDRIKSGVDHVRSKGKGGEAQGGMGPALVFGGLEVRAKVGQRGVVSQISPGVYLLAVVPEPIFAKLGTQTVAANAAEVARQGLNAAQNPALGFLPLLLLPLLTESIKARRERREAEKNKAPGAVPAAMPQLGCCGGAHTSFGCSCKDCKKRRG